MTTTTIDNNTTSIQALAERVEELQRAFMAEMLQQQRERTMRLVALLVADHKEIGA